MRSDRLRTLDLILVAMGSHGGFWSSSPSTSSGVNCAKVRSKFMLEIPRSLDVLVQGTPSLPRPHRRARSFSPRNPNTRASTALFSLVRAQVST